MSESQTTSGSPGSRPAPRFRRWAIVGLITMVGLVSLAAIFERLTSTQSALAGVCGQLSFTRHGLPCDIPLPLGRHHCQNVVGYDS